MYFVSKIVFGCILHNSGTGGTIVGSPLNLLMVSHTAQAFCCCHRTLLLGCLFKLLSVNTRLRWTFSFLFCKCHFFRGKIVCNFFLFFSLLAWLIILFHSTSKILFKRHFTQRLYTYAFPSYTNFDKWPTSNFPHRFDDHFVEMWDVALSRLMLHAIIFAHLCHVLLIWI